MDKQQMDADLVVLEKELAAAGVKDEGIVTTAQSAFLRERRGGMARGHWGFSSVEDHARKVVRQARALQEKQDKVNAWLKQ